MPPRRPIGGNFRCRFDGGMSVVGLKALGRGDLSFWNLSARVVLIDCTYPAIRSLRDSGAGHPDYCMGKSGRLPLAVSGCCSRKQAALPHRTWSLGQRHNQHLCARSLM